MKCVFGPVPSRRLGQSLGIDPVPLKTCNWNCVYCQLGRSRPLINERKDFFPVQDMIFEVQEALTAHKPEEIDWVTLIGSGETTLHSGIGDLIHQVKALTPLPVAVITNGSLLYQPDVRQELVAADAVLPSLDAGDENTYQKINRPYPDLTFKCLVEGLSAFRKVYRGKFWIEVMLVHDLNDTEAALMQIAGKLEKIQPDEVHILQPTRPPVETWVKPADEEGLQRACRILGKTARVIDPAEGTFDLSSNEDLMDAIVSIITRHPMKETEIIKTLTSFTYDDVIDILKELEKSGKAQIVTRNNVKFWSASSSFYPIEGKDTK